MDLAGRVEAVLKDVPQDVSRLSCKSLKAQARVTGVALKTFQRALTKVLDGNPQWKRVDQILERVASPQARSAGMVRFNPSNG